MWFFRALGVSVALHATVLAEVRTCLRNPQLCQSSYATSPRRGCCSTPLVLFPTSSLKLMLSSCFFPAGPLFQNNDCCPHSGVPLLMGVAWVVVAALLGSSLLLARLRRVVVCPDILPAMGKPSRELQSVNIESSKAIYAGAIMDILEANRSAAIQKCPPWC